MKKMISLLLSVIMTLAIFLSTFTAQAAVYKPDVELYSKAYMLINLDDNSFPIVAEKNVDEKLYPASLTKIVTAMVALNNVSDLSETTTVSKQSHDILLGTGAQIAQLKVGDSITVEDLLYLTLVHSACDATEVLAEYVGGTREKFVEMMNEYVESLGCENTHFTNPDGLHDDNHYTTASDMAKISLDAVKNETFMKISTTVQYKYKNTNFYHTNLMLRSGYVSYFYKYAQGIKTGSTSDAGYCVVTKASKDGYNYLAIVMGAPVIDYNNDGYKEKCSFIDAASLFKWAFNSLKYSTLIETNEVVDEIAVKSGKDADLVQLVAKDDVTTIVPSSLDKSTIIIEPIDKPENISAPIKKGDFVCKANIKYADQVVATVDLVAANDVELSTFLKIVNAIKSFFSLLIVKIILFVVLILGIVYISLFINNMNKKKKRRQEEFEEDSSNNDNRRNRGKDDLPPPRRR